jgi:tyrosine-protein kinase Etk/Wzc
MSESIIILGLFRIFLKYKWQIIISTFIVGIITTLIMFFVVEPIFKSTATVKITDKTGVLSSLFSEGIMPDLSDIGNLGGSSSSKELALYEEILTSRKAIEETIIKFNLNEEWNFKYIQDAVKHFRGDILEIKKNKLSGTMEIGIYDKNPQRAKEVAEYMIEQLNKINTEMNVLNAKNNREFIEQRYKIIKEDLKKAEDSLKQYQEMHGLFPDVQVRAVIQSEAQMEAEIKSEEVKLEILKKILSPGENEVKIQEGKISSLKSKLSEIRHANSEDQFFSLKDKPEIVMNYMRLQRNVEIQNKILIFILPIFEQAKIEEKKEMPSVIILDQPNFPEKKAKPKRIVYILLAMISTFVFIYGGFYIKEKYPFYVERIKSIS